MPLQLPDDFWDGLELVGINTVFVGLQAADMLAALRRRHAEMVDADRHYDYEPLLRAIVSDIDPSEEMIRTHPWHWGKETLVRMAEEYMQWGKRFPLALLPSLTAELWNAASVSGARA